MPEPAPPRLRPRLAPRWRIAAALVLCSLRVPVVSAQAPDEEAALAEAGADAEPVAGATDPDASAAPETPPAIELPLEQEPLPPGPVASGVITDDGRWRGGIALDEDFRSFIRFPDLARQEIARQISDVLLGGLVLYTWGIDAGAIPGAQGNGDVVWRAEMAATLALGATIALGDVVKRLVGRARPYERECAEHPDRQGCDDRDVFASFYSLHSGVAFSQAGFSCSMHLTRNLYRDVATDAIACASSLVIATTIAILRMVSDRHYLSDVCIGAAIGLIVGWVMPFAIVPEPARDVPAPASGGLTRAEPGAVMLHFGGGF